MLFNPTAVPLVQCRVVEVARLDFAERGTRLLTLRTLDYFLTQPFFSPP